MKKKIKNQGAPGFEPGTSRSAVESSLIKNVNGSHFPYFLILCWLQPSIQAEMGNEQSIYYKVYDFTTYPIPHAYIKFRAYTYSVSWWVAAGVVVVTVTVVDVVVISSWVMPVFVLMATTYNETQFYVRWLNHRHMIKTKISAAGSGSASDILDHKTLHQGSMIGYI